MTRFTGSAVAFLSAASVAAACTTTTAGTGGASSSSGGSSSGGSSSGVTSSSSGTVTSGSSGTTSSSGASSSGGTDEGACVGNGNIDVPASNSPADPSGCPGAIGVSSADLDAEIGWRCAAAAKGACTTQEITTIEANLKNAGTTSYYDLANGVSGACKSCVITKTTDPSWGPIVATAADNGATGFINFGACFGYLMGADCGKALQYEQACYNVACSECATDSTQRQKCIEVAGDGGCKGFGDATAAACPDLQSASKQCNNVLDSIRTLCGL